MERDYARPAAAVRARRAARRAPRAWRSCTGSCERPDEPGSARYTLAERDELEDALAARLASAAAQRVCGVSATRTAACA